MKYENRKKKQALANTKSHCRFRKRLGFNILKRDLFYMILNDTSLPDGNGLSAQDAIKCREEELVLMKLLNLYFLYKDHLKYRELTDELINQYRELAQVVQVVCKTLTNQGRN